jgi:hypothetical protein
MIMILPKIIGENCYNHLLEKDNLNVVAEEEQIKTSIVMTILMTYLIRSVTFLEAV